MTYSTIGDHVELQRGTTYKSALLDQPGPVLLGLGSIERDGGFRSDKLRTYGGPSAEKLLVCPGDLYVSLKDVTQAGDLLGAIARVPESVSVGRMTQDTVKLIFKSDIPKEYFYWLLRTPQYRQYCRSHATGTTNLGLSRDDFFSFKIPNLDAEKRLLTDSLESVEAKIRTNHQINQTLEQMAQAIFKSWFVDFEPVKAKIAALEAGGSEEDALLAAMQAISGKDEAELTRLQAEQPEQYAELRATAELFPSAMQDSELGEIPAGWSVSPISDFGRIVCGKTPSKQKSEFYGGHIPFIKIPDMHGNMFATTTSDHLSPMGAASQPKKAIPKGSVCVSCIATVGQVVIATEESHTNQQINSIIPFEDNYTAYLYFRMESLYEHLHDLASGGSATLNLNTGSFSRIQILMPSDSILAGYAKSCTALLDRILCNMRESQSLSILRDTLLPKLLSGELSVPDVEDQLAEDAEPANV